MTVLIDTPIWSEMLRRQVPNPQVAEAVKGLVAQGAALMIGPVRQEILSGVKSDRQFEKLRRALQGFPDVALQESDFELAAQFFNACRSRGLQGSNTDFLISSVSVRIGASIYTTDRDFDAFAKVLPITLHVVT